MPYIPLAKDLWVLRYFYKILYSNYALRGCHIAFEQKSQSQISWYILIFDQLSVFQFQFLCISWLKTLLLSMAVFSIQYPTFYLLNSDWAKFRIASISLLHWTLTRFQDIAQYPHSVMPRIPRSSLQHCSTLRHLLCTILSAGRKEKRCPPLYLKIVSMPHWEQC